MHTHGNQMRLMRTCVRECSNGSKQTCFLETKRTRIFHRLPRTILREGMMRLDSSNSCCAQARDWGLLAAHKFPRGVINRVSGGGAGRRIRLEQSSKSGFVAALSARVLTLPYTSLKMAAARPNFIFFQRLMRQRKDDHFNSYARTMKERSQKTAHNFIPVE